MKLLIVFVALFAVALARPGHEHEHTEILKLDSDVRKDGYKFEMETSDGTSRHEVGELKEIDKEHALVVHGSFSYKDEKDGQVYTVNYVADEHGFQPEGKHLPQQPQIQY